MFREPHTSTSPHSPAARHVAPPEMLVTVAEGRHLHHAPAICAEMESSARIRGTGIAKRSPEYVKEKILAGKAVIAVTPDDRWAGFCYIESWSHGRFVANSGLIVASEFRHRGLARMLKRKIFVLSRTRYPDAKLFGLTTGLPVMKINSELGYLPVTYSELTADEEFWSGCTSCVNHHILVSKERKNCLCTAMLFDPASARSRVNAIPCEDVDEATAPIPSSAPIRHVGTHAFLSRMRALSTFALRTILPPRTEREGL